MSLARVKCGTRAGMTYSERSLDSGTPVDWIEMGCPVRSGCVFGSVLIATLGPLIR